MFGHLVRWIPISATVLLIVVGIRSASKSKFDWQLGLAILISLMALGFSLIPAIQ